MPKSLHLILLFLMSSLSYAQGTYPTLTEIVTDKAQIFTPSELEELRTKLYQFESETSNQLVILTIDALGNETIEGYAFEVFNQNKLGQEGKDNGILILFSKLDREVRIEVGYGLISLVDEKQGGNLLNRISSVRKSLAIELGIVIPPIRIRDYVELEPNSYLLWIVRLFPSQI